MADNQVNWFNEQDRHVVVTVKAIGYRVTIDGKEVASVMGFSSVPMAVFARAQKSGVVAFLGPVAVTAHHKAEIEAIRAAITPVIAPLPIIVEPTELAEIEARIANADARISQHDENPASAYFARDGAERARATWIRHHSAEWQQVQEARAAAHTQHIAEIRQGYIARGLD